MATIETNIIQQTPEGASDVQTVIGVNPDGTSLGAGVTAVNGKINTSLIQQPATGGARMVPVVIVVDSEGNPIAAGGADLPTGTVSQVMGFDAQGNPVAKDLNGQMWAEPLTGVPAATYFIAAMLEDGTKTFVPASVSSTPDNIVVRDSSGHISASPATQPTHLVTQSQLEAFEDTFYETDEVVRIHEAQITALENKWTDAMKAAIDNLTESSTLEDVIAALKA